MRDDGTLFVCNLVNEAENGEMPKEVLSIQNKFWFENRAIGINRFYAAQGVNQRIDKVVRIPWVTTVEIGQYAVLGNGDQYRITMVSEGEENFQRTKMVDSKYYRQPTIASLKYTELTLTKVENYYAVATS